MKVVEVFSSIQGEGAWMGCACTFVRLAGCPVKCDFCDSKDSWGSGKDMSEAAIVDLCKDAAIPLVVITGGEPLMQPSVVHLAKMLRALGYRIHVETSGYYDIPDGVFDWVTVSPKPNTNYRIPAGPIAEFKYVVTPDFDPSVIPEGTCPWLQPCDGLNWEVSYRKCYELAMRGVGRCGVQLHKVYDVK